jgi:polar amino acid transport system substrate-binding protein
MGVVLFCLLSGVATAADTLDTIKERGTLIVGVKHQVPPFGFLDETTGKLAGYDVDLATALAKQLGVKLELRPVEQQRRISALLEGRVDLIAANLVADADVGKVISFSDGYLLTGVGFITRKGEVSELKDLRGKKIGVMAGSFAEQAVISDLPGSAAIAFDDLWDLVAALEDGTLDAGAGDMSILPAVEPSLTAGKYESPAFHIEETPYVVGMRQGDKALMDFVNQALQKMQDEGELKAIFDRWFWDEDEGEGKAAEDGAVGTAAGVIVRRATTPPRFLAVVMKGVFEEGEEVSIFNTQGDFVCNGLVGRVFGEEVYIAADFDKHTSVLPGFAVGAGVNMEAAKEAILKHQDILTGVATQSEADKQALLEEINEEAKAEEARRNEKDMMNHRSHQVQKAQRNSYRNNSKYYRSSRYSRRYYRY